MQTITCRMEEQQGPIVWHRELYSIQTIMEKNMKMNYTFIIESVCYRVEINTMLQTKYTSIK